MVSAYGKNGRPREALELFALMLRSGARPNQFTFGSAASACAGAQCARSGEQVHACAAKGPFAGNMFVHSALMDMHLRCGSVEDASRLFAEMERKDVVSWNALIRGFVERRHYNDALGLFSLMLRDGMLIILLLTDLKYLAYLMRLKSMSPCSVSSSIEDEKEIHDTLMRQTKCRQNGKFLLSFKMK